MQTSLWLLSVFDFFLQESVLFVLLIPTLSPHLHPQTSNPITHCFVRTHWIWFFIYTDNGWTPLLVEFLVVLVGTVRRAQQEGSRPLVYLKVRIVFVLAILTTYLPSWLAAPRGTYEEEVKDSDIFLSTSFLCACSCLLLSVKKWEVFQGLLCPKVHLVLTYSLPQNLGIIFTLEDAFVI